MEIYSVSLASFENVRKTDRGYRYTIDEKDVRQILGVVCGDYVVDIETCQGYYLLKRNQNGTLKSDEFDKIELNQEYALNLHSLNLMNVDEKVTVISKLKAAKAQYVFKKQQKVLKKQK